MKIADALVGIDLLYVDTAPFIYYVEDHLTYADKAEAIFRRANTDGIYVLTSVVSLTEVLTKPLRVGDKGLENLYRLLLQGTRNVGLLPVSAQIAERAAHLRASYNLRTPDALQVATALDAGCDALLTNDLGLKRVTEVRVLVLDELELDPT